VVTDGPMPHLNGREFLAQSRMSWPDTPVILYSETRYLSDMAAVRGACAWIRQSSDSRVLLSVLAMAMEPGVEWKSTPAMQRVGAEEGIAIVDGTKPGIVSNVAWPMELASVVCSQCGMADVHSTLLCSAQNFDRGNVSGKMPETHCNLFKMIGVGGSRGPCNRIAGECTRYPFGRRASEETEFFTKMMVIYEKRSVKNYVGQCKHEIR